MKNPTHKPEKKEIENQVFKKLLRAANDMDEANSRQEFGNDNVVRPTYSSMLREIWAMAHAIKEDFEIEELHEYTCFKCGDTFQVSHELDTDKPTCDTCFKLLRTATTSNQYLDFMNNKLQEKKELRKLLTKYFRKIDENPFLPERHSAWFNYSKIGLKTELLLMHIDAVNKLQEKK